MLAIRACVLAGVCLLAGTARAALTPAQVAQAIAERRSRVAEFQVIRQAAAELGIRVWLFGGTAAGFAHYVRWDLEREGGDERYRESFFDYDFTNIYRSTQDADLVVDASPEQAEQLENLVRHRMSFLQGSKEHWEVRLLRQDRLAPGGQLKQALLANPDFVNQHTDSNSTGMIELTDPPAGEGVVRDLRDWESGEPIFLRDLSTGRLHYYWSPRHEETTRFREGHNPPLFSVIRYLVKAFQYDLAIEEEDRARIGAVIDAFDPQAHRAHLSGWAGQWLERYGPNLIRHAVNIERASSSLEELGLREKLVALSDPAREGSLGWWLSREPLRTFAVGEGEGPTAGELGIEVVAHETSDFLAYESITRDTTLKPNVLISRPGYPGESAQQGPGFYTRPGRVGAKGTGFTIRFHVDPRAREGTDFTVARDTVVFHNRAALRVIPESLDLSLLQYFRMLRDGGVYRADRGIWTKLLRRLNTRPLAEREEAELSALVLGEAKQFASGSGSYYTTEIDLIPAARSPQWVLLREWFSLPVSGRHPEIVEALLQTRYGGTHPRLVMRRIELPLLTAWMDSSVVWFDPVVLGALLDRYASAFLIHSDRATWEGDALLERVLAVPDYAGSPQAPALLLRRKMFSTAFRLMRARGKSEEAPLLLELIESERFYSLWWEAVISLLGEEVWREHPELIVALVRRYQSEFPPGAEATKRWLDRSRIEGPLDSLLLRELWKDHPRLRQLCGGGHPTTACLGEGSHREALELAGQALGEVTALSAGAEEGGPCSAQ